MSSPLMLTSIAVKSLSPWSTPTGSLQQIRILGDGSLLKFWQGMACSWQLRVGNEQKSMSLVLYEFHVVVLSESNSSWNSAFTMWPMQACKCVRYSSKGPNGLHLCAWHFVPLPCVHINDTWYFWNPIKYALWWRSVWDVAGGSDGERVSKATCLLFGLREQARCDGLCDLNCSRQHCGLNPLYICSLSEFQRLV